MESMPGRPSYMPCTLYWKNDTTIYWVLTVEQGERARNALFPALSGLNFFREDWLPKEEDEAETEKEDEQDVDEEEIPYA